MKKIITSSNYLIITLVIAFLFAITNVNAAYLKDIPVKRVQPNGEILHCFASGDEFFNYLHDENGFTIIQNDAGYYMYAILDGDKIVPSQFVAGTINPSDVGLQPNVRISLEEYQKRRAAWFAFEDIPRSKAAGTNQGTLNNLVVFIRFADEASFSKPFSWIEPQFNNQTPGANSMINYFQTTSYGKLEIPSSFFPVPNGNIILSYQDDHPRSYYQPYNQTTNPNGYQGGDNGSERTEREHELLRKAIVYIADMVPENLNLDYNNDGRVDNVCFIVNGDNDDWATLLWPHRWALYTKYAAIHGKRVWDFNFQLADGYFNTAVLCHEMQHTLSYPDLYHYGYGGSPVGNWDIMESNPNPPQQSGAYMKWKYGGWLNEPTEIQPGKYTLNSIGNGTGFVSYKIPTDNPKQFFVLEYRNSNDPFENFNYGNVDGMLIYRINTTWNGNAGYNHSNVFDEVFIFRPGGNYPNSNGNLHQAHFGPNGRVLFDNTTNPKPTLTDGTLVTDLSISDIVVSGNKVYFTYNGGTTQFFGLTFHPNGGKGEMKPQLFEESVEQNLYLNTYKYIGRNFLGWSHTPEGEVEYEDGESIAITEDITLYAVWSAPIYFTIHAEANTENGFGTIDPTGDIDVLRNTDQTFVIQADEQSVILKFIVDGFSYFPQNEQEKKKITYTFSNVTDNHAIEAIFAPAPPPPPVYYKINASTLCLIILKDDFCGTIDPEGDIEVLENTDQSFHIQTEYPYSIYYILADDIEYYPQNEEEKYNMVYTFNNVTENHTIKAVFTCPGKINDTKKTNVYFSIQPNPATQYFEILLSPADLTLEGTTAQIFDVQGLLMKTEILYHEKTRIDISNFVKGFYIVKIGKEAKKLIIK